MVTRSVSFNTYRCASRHFGVRGLFVQSVFSLESFAFVILLVFVFCMLIKYNIPIIELKPNL